MKRRISLTLSVLALFLAASASRAQDESDLGAWFSAGMERKIASGLNAEVEAEFRLSDNISGMDRWSVGTSLSYRLFRNEAKTFDVKADLGFKFMRVYHPQRTVMKDSVYIWDNETESDVYVGREFNVHDEYSVNRYRAFASLSASYELGRFKISLRERYQFTGNDSVSSLLNKWYYDFESADIIEHQEEKWRATDNRSHILRSRLQVSYNIRGFKLDPYASVELYNDLTDGCSILKSRYLFGMEYKLNKANNIKMYYLYQLKSDGDEPKGHVAGLSYCYSF